MKNLITGATGFVGSHIAERFLNEGEEVIALARKSSKDNDIKFLEDLGAEIYYGDITKYDSIKSAIENSDRVIHSAASTGEWIKKKQAYDTNIKGTQNLLKGSLENKIQRFIFISSLGVAGLRNHNKTRTDIGYQKANDNYIDTKIESEKLVRCFSEKNNLPFTIMRPGFVYGERDRRLMKRMLENLEKGKFMFIGNGKNKMDLVYAGNLADAVYLASQTDRAVGEIYNVTDDNNLDIETFVYKICDIWGFEKPTKHIPIPVAKIAANMLEKIAKIRGKKEPPLLTKTRLKFMSLNLDFDISKTREHLGYKPAINIDEGLKKTKKWIDTYHPYN